MGANASTAVPVYVSGQVLDAARLNLTNAGVPVFATTSTRDAAFDGSGEKTLAEGQLAYIEASNIVQYYDGASWVIQNAFALLTTQSFSAVSSFSLPANTFSAVYTNYKIFLNIDSSATSETLSMRVRASGTDNDAANYAWVRYGYQETSGAIGEDSGNALVTSWKLPSVSGTHSTAYEITVMSPNDTTFNTGLLAQSGIRFDSITNFAGSTSSGVLSVTTAYDSATILVASGTVTGSYQVYGLGI